MDEWQDRAWARAIQATSKQFANLGGGVRVSNPCTLDEVLHCFVWRFINPFSVEIHLAQPMESGSKSSLCKRY